MSEESYLLEPKEKRKKTPYEWFMTFLRVLFFICAFTLVIMTVLANMGGSGETWHEGVRSFISEFAGGRPTKLGKLNDMSFFPTVRLDVEDIEILAKPDDVVPLVKVKELRLGMPFLDVATRSPRLRELYIEGLSTIKGVFMPKEFYLDKLFIDHDQVSPQAMFRADGKIGLQSWSVEAGMEMQKSFTGKNTYVLAPKAPFSINFADVSFKGVYNHVSSDHLKIEDFELRAGEQNITGDIVISETSDKLLKVQGTLNIRNGRTVISPDLLVDSSLDKGTKTKISGEINSEKLVIDDVIGKDSVFGILTRLRELMGYEGVMHKEDGTPAFLGADDLNLHVFVQNVEAERDSYDALSFDILQEDGFLRFSKITGKDERLLAPSVMLMQDTENKDYIAIVQDGDLDTNLIRPWFKHLPSVFADKQNIQTHCGIGVFSEDEDAGTVEIKAFVLQTNDGKITTEQSAITKDDTFFDKDYKISNDVSLQRVSLPKPLYDMVQASLQKHGEGSPCAPYISLRQASEE